MTRRLVFEGPHAQDRFKFCRLAVLTAGGGNETQTRDLIRKQARLLDALDSVSVEDKTIPQAERRVKDGPQVVTIAQDDFVLLQKYLDNGQWLPAVAQGVVDVQDFVDSAPKID